MNTPTLKESSRAGRIGKKIAKGIGFSVLGLVSVAAAGVGYLHTEGGQEKLRQRVEQRIGERVTTSAKVKGLTFSLTRGIDLTGVSIADRDGVDAIAVESIHVTPLVWQSVRIAPTLSELSIRGVRVKLQTRDDGSSNLTGLMRDRKPIERLVIQDLSIEDVALDQRKPDGTKIEVRGLSLRGPLDAAPASKAAVFDLSAKLKSAELKKQDMTAGLTSVSLVVKGDLKPGPGGQTAGELVLGPLDAGLALARAGQSPYASKLALPRATVKLGQGDVGLDASALQLGAVSLAALRLSVPSNDSSSPGSLGGVQGEQLGTLTLSAAEANQLLGKPLLAGDIQIAPKVSGPRNNLQLGARVSTPGGPIDIQGTLVTPEQSAQALAAPPADRAYDMKINASELDLQKIGATLPAVKIGTLELSAKGSGTDKLTATSNITFSLKNTEVSGITVESISGKASLGQGVANLEAIEVRALGQTLKGAGTYSLEAGKVRADLETDGSPSVAAQALGKTKLASPKLALLAHAGLSAKGKVHVEGNPKERLAVRVDDLNLQVLGGNIHVAANTDLVPTAIFDPQMSSANPPPTKLAASDLHANIRMDHLSLDAIGQLRGKKLPVSGHASGTLSIDSRGPLSKGDLDADLNLTANLRGGKLTVRGTRKGAQTQADVALLSAEGQAHLLDVSYKAAFANPAGAGAAPFQLSLDAKQHTLAAWLPLLPEETKAKLPPRFLSSPPSFSMHADLNGTPQNPRGTVNLAANGALLPTGAQTLKLQSTLAAHPKDRSANDLDAQVSFQLGDGLPPLALHLAATVFGPLAQVATRPVDWVLDASLPPVLLGSLPLSAPPATDGEVGLSVHAAGNRKDVSALTVTLDARKLRKGLLNDAHAHLGIRLSDTLTDLEIFAGMQTQELLRGKLNLALGGKGLLLALAQKQTLDGALQGSLALKKLQVRELLPQAVLGLPAFARALALAATVEVSGKLSDPELTARAEVSDLESFDGAPLGLTLLAQGNKRTAAVDLQYAKALGLHAELPTEALLKARKEGGEVPILVSLRAENAQLTRLLPKWGEQPKGGVAGAVTSDLHAGLTLLFEGDTRKLARVDTGGALRIQKGTFPLPGTQIAAARSFHDIELALVGKGETLAIEQLSLVESDREKPRRSASARGVFNIPACSLALDADLKDMLLFGGNFGEVDAPRASVTGALSVQAALGNMPRTVDVHVKQLELLSPDRFLRAHQQEVLSLGDVSMVGGETPVGKLGPTRAAEPGPVSTAAAAQSEKTQREKIQSEKTLDVRVTLDAPIHIKQRPLDLYASGSVQITRFGEQRVLAGKLVCEKGSLLVAGQEFALQEGAVSLGDQGAYLDLHFQRAPDVAALRDFATYEASKESGLIFAHMVGPFGKQKLTFSGLADGLFDAIATNSGGRARVLSGIDMPLTAAPQLPQIREIRQTAFMSANLPHLRFMTRTDTHSDPNDGRFAYGRFERHEGARYTESGSFRLRTEVRPQTLGQSDAEVGYDYLFGNTGRVVTGVGLSAGTRLGGGPGFFLEWSSSE
jgi:TamB, inner membrane protein subunit of TAM complex